MPSIDPVSVKGNIRCEGDTSDDSDLKASSRLVMVLPEHTGAPPKYSIEEEKNRPMTGRGFGQMKHCYGGDQSGDCGRGHQLKQQEQQQQQARQQQEQQHDSSPTTTTNSAPVQEQDAGQAEKSPVSVSDSGFVTLQDPTPVGLVDAARNSAGDLSGNKVAAKYQRDPATGGNIWATKGSAHLIEAENPKPLPPAAETVAQQPLFRAPASSKPDCGGRPGQNQTHQQLQPKQRQQQQQEENPKDAVDESNEMSEDPQEPSDNLLQVGPLPGSVNGASTNSEGWKPLDSSSAQAEIEQLSSAMGPSATSESIAVPKASSIGKQPSFEEQKSPSSAVSVPDSASDPPSGLVIDAALASSEASKSASNVDVLNMDRWDVSEGDEDSGFGSANKKVLIDKGNLKKACRGCEIILPGEPPLASNRFSFDEQGKNPMEDQALCKMRPQSFPAKQPADGSTDQASSDRTRRKCLADERINPFPEPSQKVLPDSSIDKGVAFPLKNQNLVTMNAQPVLVPAREPAYASANQVPRERIAKNIFADDMKVISPQKESRKDQTLGKIDPKPVRIPSREPEYASTEYVERDKYSSSPEESQSLEYSTNMTKVKEYIPTAVMPGAVAVPGIRATEVHHQERFSNSGSSLDSRGIEHDLPIPIAATPVDDTVLVHATAIQDMKHKRSCREAFRDRRVQLIIIISIAVVAIAIVSSVRGKRTEAPFESPESQRLISMRRILVSVSDQQALTDRLTPQYSALRWIANEDTAAISINDTERIIQRYILAVLYYSTNGDKWKRQSNFTSDKHECSWNEKGGGKGGDEFRGVTECGEHGQVTSIKLNDNDLVGPLPGELGMMQNLTQLIFDWNLLSGTIGPALGNLGKLQKLSIQNNILSGTIPPSIGKATDLTRLDLRENRLSGSLPTEIGHLINMDYLNFKGNSLSGTLGSELGLLTSLTFISVREQMLTGEIPSELGRLKNLKTLSLYANQFSGSVPTEFGSLTNLKGLHLDVNKLHGQIPSEVYQLVKLDKLWLRRNMFSGTVASELGLLTELRHLQLSENQLNSTIPTELGLLTKLEQLGLGDNILSGEIPSQIGALTYLEELDLSSNNLTGKIATEIGGMTTLTQLNFSQNKLIGTVPYSFVNLESLGMLDLSKNEIKGDLNFLCRNFTNMAAVLVDLDEVNCTCCATHMFSR